MANLNFFLKILSDNGYKLVSPKQASVMKSVPSMELASAGKSSTFSQKSRTSSQQAQKYAQEDGEIGGLSDLLELLKSYEEEHIDTGGGNGNGNGNDNGNHYGCDPDRPDSGNHYGCDRDRSTFAGIRDILRFNLDSNSSIIAGSYDLAIATAIHNQASQIEAAIIFYRIRENKDVESFNDLVNERYLKYTPSINKDSWDLTLDDKGTNKVFLQSQYITEVICDIVDPTDVEFWNCREGYISFNLYK